MSSALGSMASLARIFGLLEISEGDKKGLKAQCGIDSVEKLIENRDNLARSPYKSCHLLVASIDFIEERKSGQNDYSTADQLFTANQSLEESWEHYLALMIERARNQSQETIEKKRPRVGEQTIGKKSDKKTHQKIFRKGDVYWEEIGGETIDPDDEGTQLDELGIAAEDSPWQYDESTEHVVLAEKSEHIRIPKALFKKLFSFQRSGVEWLSGLYMKDTGGILGDEMGMGKTMQTLTFLFALMSSGAIGNALVVCPKSTLDATWLKEAMKLIPFFTWENEPKVVLVGTNLSEHQKYQVLKVARNCTSKCPHLIITSYPQVRTGRGFTSGQKGRGCFDYVVLDEAHRVKNQATQARQNLQKISKHSRKLLLTGTPFLNQTREVYSLLQLAVGTDIVGDWPQFRNQFVKPIELARQPGSSPYQRKRASELILKLQSLIRPYFLQRKKSDFMKNTIPPCFQFDVWMKLSPVQRRLYENHVQSGQVQQGIGKGWKCCLPEIHRLRSLCNHPLLFRKDQEEAGMESVKAEMRKMTVNEIISQSPKLSLAVDLLHKWRADGLKILLFSHSVQMLDIIEYVLASMEGIHACRIDGQTSQKRRKKLVEDFNLVGSCFNVMLLSIETGGEGLTLTGANKSILFDPAWNQAKTDQAVARTCRPGQTRECECIHLLTAGAVEEKMFGKQIYKGSLDRTLLGKNEDGDGFVHQKRLYDKDELTKLFLLDPPGKCESLELFQQSDEGAWTRKCSTSKEHQAVVGISRRSLIYKEK